MALSRDRLRVRTVLGGSVAAAAAGLVSCGGGGAADTTPPTVVSVRFVGPGGTEIATVSPGFVPRNAWVEIVFNTPIDPTTAVDPNVRVRVAPYFETPSQGTFHAMGPRLLFDPTVTASGSPRPFGLDANTDYEVRIPATVPTGQMLRGAGGTAILHTFTSTFRTTGGWIAESVPPALVSSRFEPGPSGGQVSPNAALVLEFSETIAPSSITSSISPVSPGPWDGIDPRFLAGDATNVAAGVAGVPIVVQITQTTPSTLRVTPTFSWGDGAFRFDVRVLAALRDLAGNQLSPSTTLGPFTCSGGGVPPPHKLLGEAFESLADRDASATDADWGPSATRGPPLTSRRVRIQAANTVLGQFGAGLALGQFVVYPAPLVGADLNNFGAVYPATNLGRRVLLSFGFEEIGGKGTIVGAAWGPDRNATFQATYPEVILRMGYGSDGNLGLGPTVSSSYSTTPVQVYRGSYSVAQRANVGNETPPIVNATGNAVLQPLFDFTGFVAWPAFSTPFDWDPVGSTVSSPRTLVFDVSAQEGNTWQDQRAYFPYPLLPPPGYPTFSSRRLATTFEADTPNPAPTIPVPNPEPSVADAAFTIVHRRAVAQSLFYTPDAVDPAGNAFAGPFSAARTLGTRSDYSAAVILSSSLPAGSSILVEYQGAMALDASAGRAKPDLSQPMTPWTTNVDVCDGYPFLRWRLTLLTDIATGGVPVVDSVVIPIRDLGP